MERPYTELALYSSHLRRLLHAAEKYIPGDDPLKGEIWEMISEYPEQPVVIMSCDNLDCGWVVLGSAEDAIDEMLSRQNEDGESYVEGFDRTKAIDEIKQLKQREIWSCEFGKVFYITMTELEAESLPEYDG